MVIYPRSILGARRAKVRGRMQARPPFLDTERYCANIAKVIEELVTAASNQPRPAAPH